MSDYDSEVCNAKTFCLCADACMLAYRIGFGYGPYRVGERRQHTDVFEIVAPASIFIFHHADQRRWDDRISSSS